MRLCTAFEKNVQVGLKHFLRTKKLNRNGKYGAGINARNPPSRSGKRVEFRIEFHVQCEILKITRIRHNTTVRYLVNILGKKEYLQLRNNGAHRVRRATKHEHTHRHTPIGGAWQIEDRAWCMQRRSPVLSIEAQ